MIRTFLLSVMCVIILGCAHLHRLTPATTPQIGWSAAQVEAALGASFDRGSTASGHAVWRYGIAPWSRTVTLGCGSANHCLTLWMVDGRVVDTLYR